LFENRHSFELFCPKEASKEEEEEEGEGEEPEKVLTQFPFWLEGKFFQRVCDPLHV
jgi:hypothetical protein